MKDDRNISEESLLRRIKRLERKLQSLQRLNQRFSWYRVGVFTLGVILTWLAGSTWGRLAGWLAFGGVLVIFLVVVFYHRRLDSWMRKFEYWQELSRQDLARSQLDWQALPYRPLPAQRQQSSLEIDLDLTGARSLHHLLDQAISEQGSLLLADWLCHPEPDPDSIYARQGIVRELAANPHFGNRLQLIFRLVSRERIQGERMLAWLKAGAPSQSLRWSLPLATLLSLLTLGLFLANAIWSWPPYWMISAIFYLFFYSLTGKENMEILDQVARLDVELGKLKPVLRYLERASYNRMPATGQLCSAFHSPENPPSAILSSLKWVTSAVGLRMNPVMGLLLNIFLPWDYFWAFWAYRFRKNLAEKLPAWLDRLYRLEAFISLAGFSRSQSVSIFPQISSGTEVLFQARDLVHPLLPPKTRVSNDFNFSELGEVALITGSNMAGKSTFIKAMGVNLCLAYAGSAVLATAWQSQPFRLHSCIRISDSINDGFSYFYAEVKCLGSLLEKLSEPEGENNPEYPVLYLIDEIFRGTNNRERLIGSRAYLQAAIQGRGIGLVATHDLELASLSEQFSKVVNYHFRDQVQEGRLEFDYKIRPGASPTTNALKIMEMEGLPVSWSDSGAG